MQCDICSTPGKGTIVQAHDMSRAVQKGFNPFYNGCIPEAMARMAAPGYPERWARSAISGDTSQSDWNVCARCMSKLSVYLPTPAVDDTATMLDSVRNSTTRYCKIVKGPVTIDLYNGCKIKRDLMCLTGLRRENSGRNYSCKYGMDADEDYCGPPRLMGYSPKIILRDYTEDMESARRRFGKRWWQFWK